MRDEAALARTLSLALVACSDPTAPGTDAGDGGAARADTAIDAPLIGFDSGADDAGTGPGSDTGAPGTDAGSDTPEARACANLLRLACNKATMDECIGELGHVRDGAAAMCSTEYGAGVRVRGRARELSERQRRVLPDGVQRARRVLEPVTIHALARHTVAIAQGPRVSIVGYSTLDLRPHRSFDPLASRRRWPTAWVVAAGTLALGCPGDETHGCFSGEDAYYTVHGQCPDADVPHDAGRSDAGHDAGPPDVGADAPRDVGTDADLDGGPTDPVWVALPDLPAGCVLERAEHPERLPALGWTSCGTGCLRADQMDQFAGFGDGEYRDGRGWIATINGTTDGRAIYKIMPVDGAPIAGWRFSTARGACTMRWGDVGEGRAGAVAHWHDDTSVTTVQERVYVAPTSMLGATTTPEAIVAAPDVGDTRIVDGLAVGSGVVALHISPDASILVEHDGVVEFAGGPNRWDPAVEGDHVVWAEAGGPWRLWHWTPETHTQIYYDPGEPITGHLLDQGTLVWTRGADFVGGFATRAELWTSPFTRSPADLAPRMVHRDAGSLEACFGDGIYLAVRATGFGFSAQLTDLADGRVRMLGAPEPGVACSYAHYVSSTEILLSCAMPEPSPVGFYYRIDPRTLPYVP